MFKTPVFTQDNSNQYVFLRLSSVGSVIIQQTTCSAIIKFLLQHYISLLVLFQLHHFIAWITPARQQWSSIASFIESALNMFSLHPEVEQAELFMHVHVLIEILRIFVEAGKRA